MLRATALWRKLRVRIRVLQHTMSTLGQCIMTGDLIVNLVVRFTYTVRTKHFIMKTLLTFTTSLLLVALGTAATAADGIMILEKSAWARATPPGSTTTAIYLTLMNRSESDISLSAVSVDISDRAELHTNTNQDGMMKMRQVKSITVPADGQAALKPHGDHIMVFDLKEQLKSDTSVHVELVFDNGETRALTIPVLRNTPKGYGDDD